MKKITIEKLPSGFYAVFVNNVFYNAACINKKTAEKIAKKLKKEVIKK